MDSAGNAYVTGFTDSFDFPTTPNTAQPLLAAGRDAFVTKLNASGSALLYSTYLGTSTSADEGRSIAIDTAGSAYVTRITGPGFPTTPGALQSTHQGAGDAFVTKVDTVLGPLVYSTYLGSAPDEGRAIAVNSSGNAFVTGIANNIIGFPGFSGSGAAPVFVTKMNTTGTAVEYSDFIGATAGNGIALNLAGEAYVVGTVNDSSGVATTPNAFQGSPAGNNEAFLINTVLQLQYRRTPTAMGSQTRLTTVRPSRTRLRWIATETALAMPAMLTAVSSNRRLFQGR